MPLASLERPRAQTALKVIDADTHLTEPHDLWVKRAPAALRDVVPQVKSINGTRSWVIDGDKIIGLNAFPNSTILKDGSKVRQLDKFLVLKMDEIHPGSSSTTERLAAMDEMGVYAQIVYPNILGFGGQNTARVAPALRLASVQIYNDAMAEMQEESGGRLLPMALLPWWDLEQALKETERTRAMGLRGINIHSDPQEHVDETGKRLPDLAERYWDPLWELCQDLEVPINFHIGASEQSTDWMGTQGWPSLTRDLRSAIGGAMLFFNNGRIVGNLILSGVPERFPGIKFVSVESGIGWVPFLMEALDYQRAEIAEEKPYSIGAMDCFRRNFFACFWFERNDISDVVRKVGVDSVLFETDFPHPTSLYPVDDLDARLGGLTLEERAKVLGGNAAKLYRIPLD